MYIHISLYLYTKLCSFGKVISRDLIHYLAAHKSFIHLVERKCDYKNKKFEKYISVCGSAYHVLDVCSQKKYIKIIQNIKQTHISPVTSALS